MRYTRFQAGALEILALACGACALLLVYGIVFRGLVLDAVTWAGLAGLVGGTAAAGYLGARNRPPSPSLPGAPADAPRLSADRDADPGLR